MLTGLSEILIHNGQLTPI